MAVLLKWNPSINEKNIDKSAEYTVPIEDFDIQLSPYTIFEEGATCIRLSGLRLYHCIINKKKENEALVTIHPKRQYSKSNKNICFKSVSGNRCDVIRLLRSKIKMPPCMERILDLIDIRPRGDRFRRRFIFNCYIGNAIACKQCTNSCLIAAMGAVYHFDEKCTKEFQNVMFKHENVYKPPNCATLHKEKLCFKSIICKGSNPLCNK